MFRNPITPITYDPSGVLLPHTGLAPGELARLAARLEAAMDEVFADLDRWNNKLPAPQNESPLDAAFIDLPGRLLAEYRSQGKSSEVGRILDTARRLSEAVDRVAVLGIGGSYMGARALMEACCHPYHNELARADRGNRPRIYFEGNNFDQSTLAPLIEMLRKDAGRFAICAISKSGGTLETAVALRILLGELRKAHGGKLEPLADLVVPVTGGKGRLCDLAHRLRCRDVFPIPEGVGGRFSILSAVGLLPAAILGLDIVALLEGALAMTERCRTAPVGSNPVLDYVGVCHLMEVRRGAHVRVLSTWGKRLEAVGLWYDQLLSESLGKDGQGALPLTAVNTRDLHSRGQQHQEGRRDKLITNLCVEPAAGAAPLPVGMSDLDEDKLNELAAKTLPQILQAAMQGTNQAYRADARPTAELRLPKLDEACLGQLFQMLMLATVIEGRLIGINPYGQPGVEAYKENMNAILRGK
jgi:glucose-6-phosphate isomerase